MTSTKHLELQRNGQVVLDHTSGLMWQQSGSFKDMDYDNVGKYIAGLNKICFAGYSDWRLPTLEELMTILLRQPVDNFYADPVFDRIQCWIWTADKESEKLAWYVNFGLGYCGHVIVVYGVYVRAVRSEQ